MQQNSHGAYIPVLAAGDNVRGASLVVKAMRDGREAALHIFDLFKEPLINCSHPINYPPTHYFF